MLELGEIKPRLLCQVGHDDPDDAVGLQDLPRVAQQALAVAPREMLEQMRGVDEVQLPVREGERLGRLPHDQIRRPPDREVLVGEQPDPVEHRPRA